MQAITEPGSPALNKGMRYDRKNELATDTLASNSPSILRNKSTIIVIRWPVVLISCSLVLFRAAPIPLPFLVGLAVGVYALSNIGLYFVDESRFHQLKFNVWLIALDTGVLTASLMLNGQAETNLYLAYFLLILICAIFENPRVIALISLAAPFVYAAFFFDAKNHDSGNYLQLVFLTIVGIFYGHFAQLVRSERLLTERAEQRSQAKTELLNILSHELKTPLTVIASYSQALKNAALGEINQDQERALTKILQQTNHLENIVNVILESASVETGAVAIRREELLLSEFLDELRQNCEGTIINSRIALKWDYSASMPVVISDPGKLKIIVLNLINNAVKFTDDGEVWVSARYESEHGKMIFEVKDTGIGIAPDQLPFVFDKFWQVDSGRTRTQSGIGMGLYIVKAFTDLLGGSVRVNSLLGQGTRFVVELPTR
jgi:signal transduction histidine kinase